MYDSRKLLVPGIWLFPPVQHSNPLSYIPIHKLDNQA